MTDMSGILTADATCLIMAVSLVIWLRSCGHLFPPPLDSREIDFDVISGVAAQEQCFLVTLILVYVCDVPSV